MILSKTLATLLCMLPSVLFYIYKKQETEKLKTMRIGSELIQCVRQILEHIPLHRGMANAFLNGDSSFEEKMSSMQHNITLDIKKIDEYLTQHKTSEKIIDDWSTIKRDWQQLSSEAKKISPNDSFERHSAIVSKIIYLISDTSDEMGISSHPNASVARIIQTTFNVLPPMIELTGQARGIGTGAIAKGKTVTTVRIKLEFLTKRLKDSIEQVHRSINANQTNETRHYIDKQLLPETESHNQRLIDTINTHLMGDKITIIATDYFTIGSHAFDANIKLLDKVISALISDLKTGNTTLKSSFIMPTIIYTSIAIMLISWWL